MYKMYFNTGVRPWNRTKNDGSLISLSDHQEWKNGTLQIAFYLEHEPPEGSILKWLCNDVQEDELIYIPIVGGGMLSKYAVFTPPFNHNS